MSNHITSLTVKLPVPAKPIMPISELSNFLNSLPALDLEDRQAFKKTIEECRSQLHETRVQWD